MSPPPRGVGPAGAGEAEGAPTLEAVVAVVLRVGVLISCAVTAAGTVLTLAVPSSRRAAGRTLPGLRRGVLHPGSVRFPHTLSGVGHGLAQGDGPSLALLGLLLLIATPVLRVAVSVVGYALGRDRVFVVITAVVLAVILASFALS
ncbi:MAG TPA: DUF1634 domain-containing protein [Acidimicrobiales bacterium]|nr:DUF1634 domain-containing protein [Acidimicrobiales bacterium]